MRGRSQRLLVVCFLVALLSGLYIVPANAYALEGVYWSGSSSLNFCEGSSVQVHASWQGFIDTDVSHYNYLSNSAPWWNDITNCHSPDIQFSVSTTLPLGTCMQTQITSNFLNHIESPVIILFNSKYIFGNYNDSTHCAFDNAVLHEFGHSQGLAHSQTTLAVMWHVEQTYTNVQTDDVNGMKAIYP